MVSLLLWRKMVTVHCFIWPLALRLWSGSEAVSETTLMVNGQCVLDTKSKATILNNYFKSVFTKENLSHNPPMDTSGSSLPCIPNLTFTVSNHR